MKDRNMESFYEDNGQYVATTTTTAQSRPTNNLKRPLTLDLNAATNNNKEHAKKQRYNQSVAVTPILNSPDLNMLTMATPDIEKFIISTASALQTPTPSLLFNANSTKVTSEQADYARGFEDALNEIRTKEQQHQQTTAQPQQQNGTTKFTSATIPTTLATTSMILSMSGGSVTYTDLDESCPVTIKDEPQTVPNSPPMSPIDMENQEKIKLERKRQRNRVAASKCRKRKLERISKLEDKVKLLKSENVELGGVIKALKGHVSQLKQQVIDHINNGCSLPTCNVQYFVKTSNANDSDIK